MPHIILLNHDLYLKNTKAKLSAFVRSCVGWQRSKTTRHVVSSKLPIAMPNSCFERINPKFT